MTTFSIDAVTLEPDRPQHLPRPGSESPKIIRPASIYTAAIEAVPAVKDCKSFIADGRAGSKEARFASTMNWWGCVIAVIAVCVLLLQSPTLKVNGLRFDESLIVYAVSQLCR
jgi:hypothetical protein